MKRILSLFVTAIMVFAFANIAFAETIENSYTVTAKTLNANYEEISVKDLAVGDTFMLAFYFDSIPTDFTVFAMPIEFDSTKIQPVAVDEVMYSSDQKISRRDYWAVGFDSTAYGGSFTYGGSAVNTGSYLFDEAEALFYINMKKLATGSATVKSQKIEFANANSQMFLPTAQLNYTIDLGAEGEAVKTVTKSDYKIVESATIVDGKTTDTQIGAAVGIKFTAPVGVTLLPKMIWAVETSAGRKYSKAVPVDLTAVDGTITVAATFHNGIHENSFGVAEVAPLSITGVDAIFTDGTDDYFTNAADKGAKKAPASVE